MSSPEWLPYLQFLNLILVPGIWWAARLSAHVDRMRTTLHKISDATQEHESQIAVLEKLMELHLQRVQLQRQK